jgi:hypothetical protein
MSYPQHVFLRPFSGLSPLNPVEKVDSITFCSCVPCRTELEQIPTQREVRIMWIKDGLAGAGLIIFMISSFVLASGAHAVLSAI